MSLPSPIREGQKSNRLRLFIQFLVTCVLACCTNTRQLFAKQELQNKASCAKMTDDQLPPKLAAAVAAFRASWTRDGNPPESYERISGPLYHYTTAAGLAGLLQSEKMWLTNAFQMNDPRELDFGFDIALNHLFDRQGAGTDIQESFCEEMAETIQSDIAEIFRFYVASFSQDQDDLGQWRAYGDNGRGFAIGLSSRLFNLWQQPEAHAGPYRVFVSRVVYDEKQARGRIQRAINKALQIIAPLEDAIYELKDTSVFLTELCRAVSSALIWYAITTKHPAYKHENEYRLIIVGSPFSLAPHVLTRTRGSDLVSHIALPMKLRTGRNVTRIVVGPTAPPHAEEAVQNLLRSLDMQNAAITRSGIPYRN